MHDWYRFPKVGLVGSSQFDIVSLCLGASLLIFLGLVVGATCDSMMIILYH